VSVTGPNGIAIYHIDLVKLRTMARPKKIKTAIWVGKKQWAFPRTLADRLDRTAAQLVREVTGRVRWHEARAVTRCLASAVKKRHLSAVI